MISSQRCGAEWFPDSTQPCKEYNSFAIGKWHLTPMHEVGPSVPFDHWPTPPRFAPLTLDHA